MLFNFNLILAVFWFVVGGVVLAWHWIDPTAPFSKLFGSVLGTGISVGWLGILMGFFNLARWWSYHSYLAERRRLEDATLRRERAARLRQQKGYEEPDPNFRFTDPEPGTAIKRDETNPP
jgi:hypothetical protein